MSVAAYGYLRAVVWYRELTVAAGDDCGLQAEVVRGGQEEVARQWGRVRREHIGRGTETHAGCGGGALRCPVRGVAVWAARSRVCTLIMKTFCVCISLGSYASLCLTSVARPCLDPFALTAPLHSPGQNLAVCGVCVIVSAHEGTPQAPNPPTVAQQPSLHVALLLQCRSDQCGNRIAIHRLQLRERPRLRPGAEDLLARDRHAEHTLAGLVRPSVDGDGDTGQRRYHLRRPVPEHPL